MMKTLVGLMALGGALMLAPPADAQENSATQTIQVQDRGRGDAWRYRRHNGRWWYWMPNGTWVYWEGGRWVPYSSRFVWGGPRYVPPRYYAPGRRYYNYRPGWRYGYRYRSPYYGLPYYRYGYRYGPGIYIGRGGIGIRF